MAAARASSTWKGLAVPDTGITGKGWDMSHARATCDGVARRVRASFRQRFRRARLTGLSYGPRLRIDANQPPAKPL